MIAERSLKCMCKKDDKWLKLMIIGKRSGCHQRPERSFFYKEYQFPICARCTGVIIGYICGIILYFAFGTNNWISLAGCTIMLIDWLIQRLKIHESTNIRRLISGILGGYGIISLYAFAIEFIFRKISMLNF